jgi:hypothetical protein
LEAIASLWLAVASLDADTLISSSTHVAYSIVNQSFCLYNRGQYFAYSIVNQYFAYTIVN